MGLVVWRSGWDRRAVLFDFRCGDYYYGHQHRDTGSFILHRLGHLAIDPGPYFTYAATNGKTFDNNYHHAPVAHNLVALFRTDGTPIDQRIPRPSDSAYYMHKERPEDFNVGDILAYEDTRYYAYLLADITPAYEEDLLKKQLRAVVYLKPETFVIYDRTVTGPGVVKRWLLHTKVPPQITGEGKVVEGSPRKGIVEYRGASAFTVRDGEGELLTQVLLPEEPLTRTIGGDGYRYWVNGTNYHYGELTDPRAKRALENHIAMIGWGRVEVEDPSDDSTFLVVLTAYPAGEPPEGTGAKPAVIKEGGKVGLRLRRGPLRFTVTFSRELPVTGHITVTDLAGNTLTDSDFATEVKPEPYRP